MRARAMRRAAALRQRVAKACDGRGLEADAVEGVEGFLLVGHAVKILRQHDVLNGGEIGNQMKLLKDEADLVGTNAIQLATRNGGDVQIVEPDFTGAGTVEATNEIDKRGFAGTGRAHDGNPFAGSDFERKIVERANFSGDVGAGGINAADLFQLDQRCTAEEGEKLRP